MRFSLKLEGGSTGGGEQGLPRTLAPGEVSLAGKQVARSGWTRSGGRWDVGAREGLPGLRGTAGVVGHQG